MLTGAQLTRREAAGGEEEVLDSLEEDGVMEFSRWWRNVGSFNGSAGFNVNSLLKRVRGWQRCRSPHWPRKDFVGRHVDTLSRERERGKRHIYIVYEGTKKF